MSTRLERVSLVPTGGRGDSPPLLIPRPRCGRSAGSLAGATGKRGGTVTGVCSVVDNSLE